MGMEVGCVPLLVNTWRPILLCGLLLASKMWQDVSSWNVEFARFCPEFPLDSINRLELQFCRLLQWDLYVSGSLYSKYFSALQSLLNRPQFRQRYRRIVGDNYWQQA